MKNEKDLWIDQMMSAAEAPEPDLKSKNAVFDKILHRIHRPEVKNNTVTFKQFSLAGVAAILIITLNIGVIALSEVRDAANQEVKTNYGLSSINLDLYP